ncbi:pseudouridine synthase [Rhizosphaericola mali]|uniref:Pseudouridine synthase n=1 Tax=Rhizosphaericola mali TaxID=2545455 RepID=A0A5P2G0N1_9BACT|nr:pseudouridine synthase [Rhizosphaericola mali]QES87679.1 rRNA pseudouridine synthase [Rhizosphaericola mali]
MGAKGFDKFINKELSGAKKKEKFKQEKRAAKAELKAKGNAARQRNNENYRKVTKDNFSSQNATNIPNFRLKKGKDEAAEGETKLSHKEKYGNTKHFMKRNITKSFAPAIIENKEKGEMPLNKYLAHSGVCGRREAADIIKEGVVKVNNEVVTTPGFKVSSEDNISVKGKKIFLQKNLVYILINKPKDHLTTVSDPQGRRTVYDLVKNVTEERIYPIGRLDRNTTGVLLLTNDGDMAQKLTHPKFGVKKIYEVKLDKDLTKKDAEAIINGITLEDGLIQADSVGYVDPKDKSLVGIEIHSGRNRIVRRIFEYLGYEVKALDRVMFANLTKKNVERGHWRFLSEKEVRQLKFLNQSFVKKPKDDDDDEGVDKKSKVRTPKKTNSSFGKMPKKEKGIDESGSAEKKQSARTSKKTNPSYGKMPKKEKGIEASEGGEKKQRARIPKKADSSKPIVKRERKRKEND